MWWQIQTHTNFYLKFFNGSSNKRSGDNRHHSWRNRHRTMVKGEVNKKIEQHNFSVSIQPWGYLGNTKNMSQFPRFGYGGFVSFSRISWFISLKRYTLFFLFIHIGYYDGVIFHRSALPEGFRRLFIFLTYILSLPPASYLDFLYRLVIKQAQEQGESPSMAVRIPFVPFHQVLLTLNLKHISSEQFEDEIHPRLRFPHRGLVAMANNGTKNSNDSQFFITLGMGWNLIYSSWSETDWLLPRSSRRVTWQTYGVRSMYWWYRV